jgi:hypothetical protein
VWVKLRTRGGLLPVHRAEMNLTSTSQVGSETVLFPASLGVRNNVEDDVGVAGDDEIEPPIVVCTGLPEVLGFVVLLGVERWMVEILC